MPSLEELIAIFTHSDDPVQEATVPADTYNLTDQNADGVTGIVPEEDLEDVPLDMDADQGRTLYNRPRPSVFTGTSHFSSPGAPSDPDARSGELFRPEQPRSRLLDPIHLDDGTFSRVTPEITNDVGHLNITSSDETSDDSLDVTDASSIEDETFTAPPFGLPSSSLPTGLCYDERMRFHSEVAAPTDEAVHPEDPRRIYYIFKELCDAGLASDGSKKFRPLVRQPLKRIDAREATREECCLVHTQDHYDFVKSTADMTSEQLIDLSEAKEMDSIYFNQFSYFSAKLSAGGAIETCRAVVNRSVKNAIAVIRPPGHHAEVHCTMGFCLFNNVCVASKVCQEDFGEDCRKILILDWDVHHGNGCQKAFYDDPNILYISMHVHLDGQFYPAGQGGNMFMVGEGPGLGKNINIPWPTKGMGDGDYMYAFQNVVMPVATEFDPDLVIVAAGFDAAAGDELGGCFVTPPCYAHMTHMLMSLAGGKVAVCLEGGYNLSAISKSALAVTRTLMGEPPDRLLPTAATSSAVETVQQVKTIHSKYWRCLHPKDPVAGMFGGEQLHTIIREWQAKHLYDNYKLTQLHIYRDNVSRSFEHQVLATPNYESKQRLLAIFHDPPDLMKTPGLVSTEFKLHETWLVDGTKEYVRWAVDHDFAVIDVNIPQSITDNETGETVEYRNPDRDVARKNGERLALYLWENYIEPYDFEGGIFLMGVGDAFHGLAKLISDNESIYPQLSGIIAFIANNPVRPVSSPNTSWVATWYRDNSRVFVSPTHQLWEKAKEQKKLSKRYGRVERTTETTLHKMMLEQDVKNSVLEWIWARVKKSVDENEAESMEELEEDDVDVEGGLERVVRMGRGMETDAPSQIPRAAGAGSGVGGAGRVGGSAVRGDVDMAESR